jgi:hypothetical protein
MKTGERGLETVKDMLSAIADPAHPIEIQEVTYPGDHK